MPRDINVGGSLRRLTLQDRITAGAALSIADARRSFRSVLCATAIPLKRQYDEYLVGCREQGPDRDGSCWAPVFAELRAAQRSTSLSSSRTLSLAFTNKKAHDGVTTGTTAIPAFPAGGDWFYGYSRALPVNRLSCHTFRLRGLPPRIFDASVGAQDHHGFQPVLFKRRSSTRPLKASPHPYPTFVTTRTPPSKDGLGGLNFDLPRYASELFFGAD